MKDPIKYFEYDQENLTDSEKRVIESLIKVGELIHAIWLKQLDKGTGEASFYPKDAKKAEIMSAAKENPEILSPYTKVIKEDGELKAISYSELYEEEIREVVSLLDQTCIDSSEGDLNAYLGKVSDALKSGNFDDLEEVFLKNRDTKIEIMIGPIETYEDKIFSVKKAFQYNLRILKSKSTEETDHMIDVMKQMQILRPEGSAAKTLLSDEIFIRIDEVVMLAGRQARVLLSSSNHPNEAAKVKKYGSKIVVFTTSMYEKFDKNLMPLLSKVKGCDACERVPDMKEATYRLIALHEITEGIVKFDGMSARLGKHQDYIRELNADILGVHSAKYHVLNGVITNDQYRDLLTMFILFAIDTCNNLQNGGSLIEYSKGFAIAFNFFRKTESVRFSLGKVIIDYTKLSRDIEVLSNIVLQILESGSEGDAQDLLDEYGSYNIFKKFPKA